GLFQRLDRLILLGYSAGPLLVFQGLGRLLHRLVRLVQRGVGLGLGQRLLPQLVGALGEVLLLGSDLRELGVGLGVARLLLGLFLFANQLVDLLGSVLESGQRIILGLFRLRDHLIQLVANILQGLGCLLLRPDGVGGLILGEGLLGLLHRLGRRGQFRGQFLG